MKSIATRPVTEQLQNNLPAEIQFILYIKPRASNHYYKLSFSISYALTYLEPLVTKGH